MMGKHGKSEYYVCIYSVCIYIYMCQGLNSHYFHVIGDGKLNPIVGVYIPIIRILQHQPLLRCHLHHLDASRCVLARQGPLVSQIRATFGHSGL